MTCVDCGRPIVTPTPDPFRCATCRIQITPQRVTDFRVDRVELSVEDYWHLPAETRRLIETYASPRPPSRVGVVAFEIAIYRWAEIQADAKGAGIVNAYVLKTFVVFAVLWQFANLITLYRHL